MRTRWLAVALALGVAVTGEGGAARPQVVAHRGGALLWPENSLTAFRGAIGLGADFLEMDLHQTRDGEVVVIHDPTLDRTTTGRGAVRDHTWTELAALTLRGTAGEAPPRFRDLLDMVEHTSVGLLVEIKRGPDGAAYPGIEEKVLALLTETGVLARSRVTVMAFEWDTLARLRTLSPSLRLTGLLGRRDADRLGGVSVAAERLAALRANDLGIERTLLTPEAVAAARAAGLTIGVWTVNDPDELRRALAAGVDYVTTDRPDLALTLRGAARP
jgi:glycerophosphoryl diester phosphodiesterase